MTYKILFNDAVAMTGGQPTEGGLTVSKVAAQLVAEGVREIVVVSEEPARYRSPGEMPASVAVVDRSELDTVQKRLREYHASQPSSMTKPVPPKSDAGASAVRWQRPRGTLRSILPCARAVETARPAPVVLPSSRWRRSLAASALSTSRRATRT